MPYDVMLMRFVRGTPPEHVSALVETFGLDEVSAHQLVGRLPRVVKRNMNMDETQRYRLALERLGGEVIIKPTTGQPGATAEYAALPFRDGDERDGDERDCDERDGNERDGNERDGNERDGNERAPSGYSENYGHDDAREPVGAELGFEFLESEMGLPPSATASSAEVANPDADDDGLGLDYSPTAAARAASPAEPTPSPIRPVATPAPTSARISSASARHSVPPVGARAADDKPSSVNVAIGKIVAGVVAIASGIWFLGSTIAGTASLSRLLIDAAAAVLIACGAWTLYRSDGNGKIPVPAWMLGVIAFATALGVNFISARTFEEPGPRAREIVGTLTFDDSGKPIIFDVDGLEFSAIESAERPNSDRSLSVSGIIGDKAFVVLHGKFELNAAILEAEDFDLALLSGDVLEITASHVFDGDDDSRVRFPGDAEHQLITGGTFELQSVGEPTTHDKIRRWPIKALVEVEVDAKGGAFEMIGSIDAEARTSVD